MRRFLFTIVGFVALLLVASYTCPAATDRRQPVRRTELDRFLVRAPRRADPERDSAAAERPRPLQVLSRESDPRGGESAHVSDIRRPHGPVRQGAGAGGCASSGRVLQSHREDPRWPDDHDPKPSRPPGLLRVQVHRSRNELTGPGAHQQPIRRGEILRHPGTIPVRAHCQARDQRLGGLSEKSSCDSIDAFERRLRPRNPPDCRPRTGGPSPCPSGGPHRVRA